MKPLSSVEILGIKASVIDLSEMLERIGCYAESAQTALINNVNVQALNLAYKNPVFRKVLNDSEIVFCDGFGVKLGAALCGIKLGQRMTPPDWIDDLFKRCIEKGYRCFFVGDEKAVVGLFVDELMGKYPELKVAGYRDGYFELDGNENDQLIEEIRASSADIIITGMGMPRQEIWAADAKDKLDKGVFIATGALFRWYTGYEKRAPKWMTDHGLEWLARLWVSPVKHFKRYVVGIPVFFFRVILWRIRNLVRGH